MRDARTEAWRTEPRHWEQHAGWRTVTHGVAEGPTLALNLNTLRSNTGTPEMPDFDIQQPYIVSKGSKRVTVNYNPDIRVLLEQVRLTGDRSRLWFMKVDLSD